jgi:hypothetical protein
MLQEDFYQHFIFLGVKDYEKIISRTTNYAYVLNTKKGLDANIFVQIVFKVF